MKKYYVWLGNNGYSRAIFKTETHWVLFLKNMKPFHIFWGNNYTPPLVHSVCLQEQLILPEKKKKPLF